MSSSPPILTAILSQLQTIRLLAKLETILPYTVPLTRRIQCHLRQPKETSGVILSVTPQASMRSPFKVDIYEMIDDWLSANDEVLKDSHTPWVAAFVDLSAPGTTQGWVFGSWELPQPSKATSISSDISSLHKKLVHSLFHDIHDTLVPAMPIAPPDSWCWLRDNGKWVSQPYSRAKVLFGTLHEGVRQIIDNKSVARVDAMYDKWIFGPETLLSNEATNGETEAKGLPEGYSFGTLDERELQTVLDGTPIPRLLAYLKEVANAGVYHKGGDNNKKGSGKGELVAYAFLGKDGSLGSLEVKSVHRGKGLAGQLSRELFRRQADTFSLPRGINGVAAPGSKLGLTGEEQQLLGREEREGCFSHADVGVENTGSQRVMEKLGGKMMWRVCWVEVDLDVLMGTKEWVRREEGEEGRGR